MIERIEVEGLRETVRDLKKVGDDTIPAKIREANLEAAEIVAADARNRAPVRTGALRGTIRATGQQSAGVVREGSSRVPYAGFIDYGGTITPKGAPVRREYRSGGRIVYPALQAKRNTIIEIYEKRLQEATRDYQ